LLPITGGVREFKCWNKHHRQDFFGAVAWSCNIYFYNIGLTAGPEALSARAKAFGFGEKTGIDLPSESSGLMPDRDWKKRVAPRRLVRRGHAQHVHRAGLRAVDAAPGGGVRVRGRQRRDGVETFSGPRGPRPGGVGAVARKIGDSGEPLI
jgi:hypothetical protein